mmetsp:Transcript_6197/g.12550  ORF Transcript_6197/g.12550 Transcript_6197/m.12550 type:complete len:91 (-) Transcript_6197:225-497(-)
MWKVVCTWIVLAGGSKEREREHADKSGPGSLQRKEGRGGGGREERKERKERKEKREQREYQSAIMEVESSGSSMPHVVVFIRPINGPNHG